MIPANETFNGTKPFQNALSDGADNHNLANQLILSEKHPGSFNSRDTSVY